MAAALVGVRPEATAATPVVEAAADQARKGPVAMGQPKEQSGVALRRSAQASLEASSRPARGQLPPGGRRLYYPLTEGKS